MNLPSGFRYSSVFCGLRKVKKNDLALIVSDTPASAASVFTLNRVKAAPVVLAQKHLKQSKGRVSAILVNAGNANCATRTGAEVALETSKAAASALGVPLREVLPSSTGVIGVEMNSAKVLAAMPALVGELSPDRFLDAAEAIMTTDLTRKVAWAEVALAGGTVRIAGMTKGSGMIAPNMATTLGFLMTDAALSTAELEPMLKRAADRSYNRLSVDGDTSTNDMLAILANGASGVAVTSRELEIFEGAVTGVAQELAEQIARDGEGATKLVTIVVSGADTEEDAARIARSIANSPLVKTAIAGADPNWGRIIAAAGYSGVEFDPRKVDIRMQGMTVCEGGLAADFAEKKLTTLLHRKECLIEFQIRGRKTGRAKFWTCDFTEGYIRINGSYRT